MTFPIIHIHTYNTSHALNEEATDIKKKQINTGICSANQCMVQSGMYPFGKWITFAICFAIYGKIVMNWAK